MSDYRQRLAAAEDALALASREARVAGERAAASAASVDAAEAAVVASRGAAEEAQARAAAAEAEAAAERTGAARARSEFALVERARATLVNRCARESDALREEIDALSARAAAAEAREQERVGAVTARLVAACVAPMAREDALRAQLAAAELALARAVSERTAMHRVLRAQGLGGLATESDVAALPMLEDRDDGRRGRDRTCRSAELCRSCGRKAATGGDASWRGECGGAVGVPAASEAVELIAMAGEELAGLLLRVQAAEIALDTAENAALQAREASEAALAEVAVLQSHCLSWKSCYEAQAGAVAAAHVRAAELDRQIAELVAAGPGAVVASSVEPLPAAVGVVVPEGTATGVSESVKPRNRSLVAPATEAPPPPAGSVCADSSSDVGAGGGAGRDVQVQSGSGGAGSVQDCLLAASLAPEVPPAGERAHALSQSVEGPSVSTPSRGRAMGAALQPLNIQAANSGAVQPARHSDPVGRLPAAAAAAGAAGSAVEHGSVSDGRAREAASAEDRVQPEGLSGRSTASSGGRVSSSPDTAKSGSGGGGLMSRFFGMFGRSDDGAVVARLGQSLSWVYDEKCVLALLLSRAAIIFDATRRTRARAADGSAGLTQRHRMARKKTQRLPHRQLEVLACHLPSRRAHAERSLDVTSTRLRARVGRRTWSRLRALQRRASSRHLCACLCRCRAAQSRKQRSGLMRTRVLLMLQTLPAWVVVRRALLQRRPGRRRVMKLKRSLSQRVRPSCWRPVLWSESIIAHRRVCHLTHRLQWRSRLLRAPLVLMPSQCLPIPMCTVPLHPAVVRKPWTTVALPAVVVPL